MSSSINFVWLEITGRCQLACEHCYAESSPLGTHGTMTLSDWTRVIDDAVRVGVTDVQFIGGEPTLHPHLLDLVDHALVRGLKVEVFSNLYRVTPAMWEAFERPGVSLATSYYSDASAEHDSIVHRRGAHTRTTANIVEAMRRGIPLRTGVIDVRDGQRVPGALLTLERFGVTEVRTDRLRQVGRGERDLTASLDQLCGNCASGVLAIAADGTVWPCVFTRWLPVGNVLTDSLPAILDGVAVADVRTALTEHFTGRTGPGDHTACNPDCGPNCNPCFPRCNPGCDPSCGPRCGPACAPKNDCTPSVCAPKGNCMPKYKCNPGGNPEPCGPDKKRR